VTISDKETIFLTCFGTSMGSTTRRTMQPGQEAAATIWWRSWPLAEQPRRSWLAVCGMLSAGGLVYGAGGGWLLASAAAAGLAGTLWQYLLPVSYEIGPLGLRRFALRRSRLFPWHAVRAYRLRPTGIVLYQRDDPTPLDLLRALFVPYPPEEDEMLCAIRERLPHAVELPR
jgi:hypothetical protein